MLGNLWLCGVGSILAVIFGHVVLAQVNNRTTGSRAEAMAIPGAVVGRVGIGVLVIVITTLALSS